VWVWLKLYGHRRQSVPFDINARHVVAVCVFELLNTLNCAVQLLLCWLGWAAGRLKQLNLNMQTQSVRLWQPEISDVINFGLELVITLGSLVGSGGLCRCLLIVLLCCGAVGS